MGPWSIPNGNTRKIKTKIYHLQEIIFSPKRKINTNFANSISVNHDILRGKVVRRLQEVHRRRRRVLQQLGIRHLYVVKEYGNISQSFRRARSGSASCSGFRYRSRRTSCRLRRQPVATCRRAESSSRSCRTSSDGLSI